MSRSRRIFWVATLVATVLAFPSEGTESDLSTTISGPSVVPKGDTATHVVTYANGGPDVLLFGYLNLRIPSGVPARLDELTGDQLDALQASAAGTDTLGNTPLLFLDQATCESLFFQLQGPSPPDPIQGLVPGDSGSFSFDLPIPMDPPVFGKLVITHPEHLAREFHPALTNHRLYYDAEPVPRYSRAGNCDNIAGGCSQLDDCFGPRLSLTDPLDGSLELVDDGGEFGDPAFGCYPLIEFTAGRIAVVRRGGCNFFDKADNAQRAGAVAVVLVNDGRCQNLGPDSLDCLINMLGGVTAGDIDIPLVMVSVTDGEPIIAELEDGGTVNASMGAMPGGTFELSSFGFSTDVNETDPDPTNNGDVHLVLVGIFADGFEAGRIDAWSAVGP